MHPRLILGLLFWLSGFLFSLQIMAIHPDVESGQRARHAGTSEIEKNDQTGMHLFASSLLWAGTRRMQI